MALLSRSTSAVIPASDRSAICPSYSWRPCPTANPGFDLKLASIKPLTNPGQSLASAVWVVPLSAWFETLQPLAIRASVTADAITMGRILLSSPGTKNSVPSLAAVHQQAMNRRGRSTIGQAEPSCAEHRLPLPRGDGADPRAASHRRLPRLLAGAPHYHDRANGDGHRHRLAGL